MNVIRRLALDRRTFLRGGAAALALPWLDAMRPALAAPPPPAPLRFLFVFAPNGKKMDDWKPAATGRGFELPFLLEPLQPVRHQVTVFSGLAINGGRAHGDGPGDHARAAASFLTCAHPRKTGGADIQVGVSIDQAIAARIGGQHRFASLELGMENGSQAGVCDSGYSCAYSNNVSWRAPDTPVAKETDPRAVFARLFGDPDLALDAAEAERRRRRQDSVLDSVAADAKAVRGKLGAGDKRKFDEFLAAIREVEKRLDQATGPAAVPVPKGLGERGDFGQRLDLMYEMIALAFASDLTRVCSLMLGNGGSNRSYRSIGVPDGHHEMSHHGNHPDKLAAIRKINRFHTERFGAFLAGLEARRDGDGTLLDHSLIVYGSGLGDGNRHNHDDLPVLLCGGRKDRKLAGRHEASGAETPMANLYLALLRQAGLRDDGFADSTAELAI